MRSDAPFLYGRLAGLIHEKIGKTGPDVTCTYFLEFSQLMSQTLSHTFLENAKSVM
jgi:hypothetical protein